MQSAKNKEMGTLHVIRLLLLCLVIGVFGMGCASVPPVTEPKQEPIETSADAAKALSGELQSTKTNQMAEQFYETLMKDYYLPEQNLYLENVEKQPDDRPNSAIWPYSAVMAAVNALVKMPNGGEKYQEDLIRVVAGADKYWQSGAKPPGYTAVLQKGKAGGRKFYDDNEWVGLDLVDAYQTLKDPKYLKRAEDVFRFAISGWTEELGGGIYWREWMPNDPPPTKNTCSNGPAAVLAMKLYAETKDPYYLEWAQKILDWTLRLKTPDNVYWDHVNSDGTIDKGTFTYNVGTILEANALLYEATGEQKYLDEARALAAGSLARFAKKDASNGVAFFPKTPWFNVVLFRGYIELYRVDPDKNMDYINAMRSNVLYAWEHAKDGNGRFSKDWSGKTGVDEVHKRLLDQAPMVEFYALLAQFG